MPKTGNGLKAASVSTRHLFKANSGGGGGSSTIVSEIIRALVVRVCADTHIDLASPGTSIDGVIMAAIDLFLAKGQTDPKENGVYYYNASGCYRISTNNLPAFVSIAEGSLYADRFFYLVDYNVVIGTDNINYIEPTALPAATVGQTLRHDGTEWAANDYLKIYTDYLVGTVRYASSSGYGYLLQNTASSGYGLHAAASIIALQAKLNSSSKTGYALIADTTNNPNSTAIRAINAVGTNVNIIEAVVNSNVLAAIKNNGEIRSKTLENISNYLLYADSNGDVKLTSIPLGSAALPSGSNFDMISYNPFTNSWQIADGIQNAFGTFGNEYFSVDRPDGIRNSAETRGFYQYLDNIDGDIDTDLHFELWSKVSGVDIWAFKINRLGNVYIRPFTGSGNKIIYTDTNGKLTRGSIDPANIQTIITGSVDQTLRHNGTSWVASNVIKNYGAYAEINANYGGGTLAALLVNNSDVGELIAAKNATEEVFVVNNDGSIASKTLENANDYLIKANSSGTLQLTNIDASTLPTAPTHSIFTTVALGVPKSPSADWTQAYHNINVKAGTNHVTGRLFYKLADASHDLDGYEAHYKFYDTGSSVSEIRISHHIKGASDWNGYDSQYNRSSFNDWIPSPVDLATPVISFGNTSYGWVMLEIDGFIVASADSVVRLAFWIPDPVIEIINVIVQDYSYIRVEAV